MPTPQRRPATTTPSLLTKAPTKAHPAAPPAPSVDPVRAGGAEPNRMLCARIPIDLHDEVKVFAARRRSSVQAIVTEALKAYLPGQK